MSDKLQSSIEILTIEKQFVDNFFILNIIIICAYYKKFGRYIWVNINI